MIILLFSNDLSKYHLEYVRFKLSWKNPKNLG